MENPPNNWNIYFLQLGPSIHSSGYLSLVWQYAEPPIGHSAQYLPPTLVLAEICLQESASLGETNSAFEIPYSDLLSILLLAVYYSGETCYISRLSAFPTALWLLLSRTIRRRSATVFLMFKLIFRSLLSCPPKSSFLDLAAIPPRCNRMQLTQTPWAMEWMLSVLQEVGFCDMWDQMFASILS